LEQTEGDFHRSGHHGAGISPMNASPIISVRDLHRSFDGVHAVRGVSFEIFPAQVVGFIGANGAGKTTTMRILATLDSPTAGSAEICGHDVVNFPGRVRARIGWMPDGYGAYDHMTVLEYLDFYARAYGLRNEDRPARLSEVMEFTELHELAERPMNKLSKGMAQRLCLGRTLLHDPEILILDEPAAGLDPKARIEFKRLVRLLSDRGKTIFISSHILSELSEMCDSLLFIDNGRIVHHGTAESLQEKATARALVDVQIEGNPAELRAWVELNPGVSIEEMRKRGARIRFDSDDARTFASTLRKMISDGLAVTEFHREGRKLEDAFIEMLKEGAAASATPPPLPVQPPPLP
jgi:ABC-2 type transport system ATP-binding protein